MTAEQERQLAWEAEFERRKAAALEKKLAEEAEIRRLAEEEAAEIALAEAAAAKEQARILAEQRKREALRAKAESELGHLKLPPSARWASGTSNPTERSHAAPSLVSIQASQEAEEVNFFPV